MRVARFTEAARAARSAAEWRDAAEFLLSDQPCVFHRNLEISAAYAWMYLDQPRLFKWAGMAAFASYHARLLLIPFKLKTTAAGAVRDEIEPKEAGGDQASTNARARRWLGVAMEDVELIRQTNNAIFRDIFWAHAAYRGTAEGFERVRKLITSEEDRPMLRGFELIERGRRLRDDDARRAQRFIHAGNMRLLWHEQSRVVQPRFGRLSDRFAQLVSVGSSLDFEADRLRHRLLQTMSFYLFMLARRPNVLIRTRSLPRINRLEHRWCWAATRVAGTFERLEAEAGGEILRDRLRRIVEAAG